MTVVRKPRVPAAVPIVEPSKEEIILSQLRDTLVEVYGRDIVNIRNTLTVISNELRTMPTKVTRNSDGLITKTERMIGGMTLEINYARDASNVITSVDRRLLNTKVNITG